MSAFNTSSSYGSVTRILHWVMALLVISMIPLGLRATLLADRIAAGASDPSTLSQTQLLFSLHKTIGVGIFMLALFRIVWALMNIKPLPLHGDRRAEMFFASVVHWALYASLLLVPLAGWIHHAATTGFAPIWWPFGQSLPFVPKNHAAAETFASLHVLFQRILAISILLHVAGAVKHHVFDRDVTLKRMWDGTAAQGDATHAHLKRAAFVAFGIYALALGIGTRMGLFEHTPAQVAALETVASDWTVTEGTLAITNTQLGANVTGSFADWTSAITYDPEVTDGVVGQVTTTISIGSLILGSVSSQAMGPEYFDVATYPTAIYQGALIHNGTGLRADGLLTIKQISVPVSFPFDLTLDGGIARMTGSTSLNRFDFDLGSGIGESTLAADVILTMTLTATRD